MPNSSDFGSFGRITEVHCPRAVRSRVVAVLVDVPFSEAIEMDKNSLSQRRRMPTITTI